MTQQGDNTAQNSEQQPTNRPTAPTPLSRAEQAKEKEDKQDKEEEQPVRQTGSLVERLRRVKRTRWIRFGLVSVIFFAWVAWLGSWWVSLFWLLLIDIYLTQFIPWNWWKFVKNKGLHTLMSWVDAIVYALVLVYFLFIFVGQNYQIPSSSLEKTLLTGDYLWVNKMVYGPRVPETPLHFPLAQNTMLGGKSYIEWPQWKYHRLKGVRNVERGDIVVFNFPAGDTVTTRVNNPDYYRLAYDYGRAAIEANEGQFGKIMWRPVDRRDAYVKRCIGLPGETLRIADGIVYINGKPLKTPKNAQFNYLVNTHGQTIDDDTFDQLGVSGRHELDRDPSQQGFDEDSYRTMNQGGFYYLPLTAQMVSTLRGKGYEVNRLIDDPSDAVYTYPLGLNYGWTHNNYGPIVIPKRGMTIKITPKNLPLYVRCIKNYEGHEVAVKGNTVLIDGRPAATYTFAMDYYWMMGDNRDNSSDSRYWGFVPEDHIIGTPMFVIISFDKDKTWGQGKVRWNRIFTDANPDK